MEISGSHRTLGKLNVLIVDDDELLGEFVAYELEGLGCEATAVDSASKALKLLETRDVDLLVTDWQMPGTDGMALVRQARARHGSDEHLHIAMMTAREDAEGIRRALQAGVDDFLYKPINPVQLELTVESARRNRLLHRRAVRRNELLSKANQRTREALRRVQADLQAAAVLHERLLPRHTRYGDVEVAHIYRPASSLGGDTIGVANLPGGGVLFFVMDVMGHGVPAALNSFHLHHRLKQMRPASPQALVEALGVINGELASSSDEHYATGICGILLPERHEAWLVRAGHPPPLMLTNGKHDLVESGGSMPLGLFPSTQFEAIAVEFPVGARLLVYSDGFTDALGLDGNEHIEDDLARLAAGPSEEAISQMMTRIGEQLTSRMPPTGFEDDVSVLVVSHVDDAKKE